MTSVFKTFDRLMDDTGLSDVLVKELGALEDRIGLSERRYKISYISGHREENLSFRFKADTNWGGGMMTCHVDFSIGSDFRFYHYELPMIIHDRRFVNDMFSTVYKGLCEIPEKNLDRLIHESDFRHRWESAMSVFAIVTAKVALGVKEVYDGEEA